MFILTFAKFKLLVEKLFSCNIKQFQSNNGGKFTSKQFVSYLNLNRIRHHLTGPYTSKQNVIAYRKHCHIMEIRLFLLAQSNLPKSFWVDAFSTVIHLINCLPTCLLNFNSPYSKLFRKPPNYFQLRMFSCACYLFLRP